MMSVRGHPNQKHSDRPAGTGTRIPPALANTCFAYNEAGPLGEGAAQG